MRGTGWRIVAFALLAVVAACTAGGPDLQQWSGAYRRGHEVNTFCPCGSDRCYWVEAVDAVQDRLRDYLERHTQRAYQPIYLVMEGTTLDEPRQGFALDYDGLIRIVDISALQSQLPAHCENR